MSSSNNQENGRGAREVLTADERLQNVVEWLDAAIWEFEPETETFAYISHRVVDMLGHPVERWLSEPGFWVQSIHPDDRDFAVNFCAVATARCEDHAFEYRAITASGDVVWLRDIVRVVPGTGTTPFRLVGLFVDVTERKREERLRIAREQRIARFQSELFELAKHGSFVRGDVPEAFRQIVEVGARTLDVEYCGVWEYLEEDELLRCLDLYDRAANTHTKGRELSVNHAPRYFEALAEGRVIAARDARHDPRTSEFNESYLIPMNVTSLMDVPVRLGGAISGIICFEHVGAERDWFADEQTFASSMADLAAIALERAQRKRLEEQLRQSQRIEALGRLAGGIAHDFNNLLTVILGHCQLLEQRTAPDSPNHRDIANIGRTAERAAALTRQLLAFSRRQLIEPRVLDLPEALRSLDEMLHRLIGDNIRLLVDLTPDTGGVFTDPGQLEQVVLNLAINARDAMPDGGTLRIEARNAELPAGRSERVFSGHAGSFVVLSVIDSGTGMDPEVLARIFEPFYTTKDPGKGTGLGLSTVYGIVEQSGGFIDVESAPGKGTAFHVYFPRVDAPPPAAEREAISYSPPSRHERILVVEDEELVREVIGDLLKQFDYRVLSAENGAEAVRILEETDEPIDLVITDLMMPGVGGFELARHVKARHPGVKVLLMSAYPNEAESRVEDEPPIPLIQKPFSLDALASKVRQLLDNASPGN